MHKPRKRNWRMRVRSLQRETLCRGSLAGRAVQRADGGDMQCGDIRLRFIISEDQHPGSLGSDGSVIGRWNDVLAPAARPDLESNEGTRIQKFANSRDHNAIITDEQPLLNIA